MSSESESIEESEEIQDKEVFVDRRKSQVYPHPNRRVEDVQWNTWINRLRDIGFLVIGLAGVVNQLFYANPPNPVLYPILASLLGAPFAFALDERRREANAREK